ncbi:molybdate ABC transporter substrate-binding protein [Geobacillus sp. NFOSA3]|uniref:molybdate ABC transporter substrate-binding protein n=1 Tax=Parageobacillus toebii TaxID=153151 RepID=UPI000E1FE093|nr:molybdate ABC transporter substrate-binding protein [Parageobacillus toebii]NNU94544.1 molybdate ABC transporter substrate-binding protein [Geobacillus sp. NFOSA3]MED4971242.1 molybdate ABC transporter substrate-binding protein [Parageobacillus toebii]MED4988416.1 molybdate ABC transporter substrate-binding protein [Parageobacillus toebii]QSB47706.1 molybdate ABC transporter substrate-binding protein [Parageobacillus toebii]RDV21602.1 molybdate ABC transporter substrate-binding protein [Par
MKHSIRIIMSVFLCASLLFIFGCTKQEEKQESKEAEAKQTVTLTISAAASLQDALTEIQKKYEKEHENIKLSFNFGSSGALQQQIEQGAPVDLFFSAAENKFRPLVDKGLINKEESKNLLGNELVLIVPKDKADTVKGFQSLADNSVKQFAIGNPETTPAGQYGKQTLTNLNLWTKVKGKIVYTKDVRQVLSYVEANTVDAGIVFKTDAQISDKVKMVDTAAANMHDPIIYPVGIIKDTKHKTEAKDFYQYLQTNDSLQVFEKYGFKILK